MYSTAREVGVTHHNHVVRTEVGVIECMICRINRQLAQVMVDLTRLEFNKAVG